MQGKQNSQAISLCKINQQDKHQYQQNMQQNPENPAKSKTKPPAQTKYIQSRTIQATDSTDMFRTNQKYSHNLQVKIT